MSEARAGASSVTAMRAGTEQMAERLGVSVWDLEVVGVEDITAAMRRITFACHSPESLWYAPGNDITLSVAPRGDGIVRRRYSIRRIDAERRLLDLEFVLHGDGPAARWANAVEIGERIEGIGPRGKITVAPDADWHLFVGDDAYVPAASSMIEALDASLSAYVYFEVESAAHEVGFDAKATVEGPRFLYRGTDAPGTSHVLADALADFELPSGRGFAYIGGEHRVVNGLRLLLIERGLSPDQIAAKPYWRLGSANGDHGEPPREE